MTWYVVTNTHRDKETGKVVRRAPALVYEDREYAQQVADRNNEQCIAVVPASEKTER